MLKSKKLPKNNKLDLYLFRLLSFTSFFSLIVLVVFISLALPLDQSKQPETYFQQAGFQDLPVPINSLSELRFGHTIEACLEQGDYIDSIGDYVDGYWIVLPRLDSFDDVEVYFRSCEAENYDNCHADAAFRERARLYDNNYKLLYDGDTRVDFDSQPIGDSRLYYLVVGGGTLPGQTWPANGNYKLTFSYEAQPQNVLLKLKGLEKKVNEAKLNVKVYRPQMTDSIWDIGETVLYPNDDMSYTASFNLYNPDFDHYDYTLLLKGSKHLQARFDDFVPKKYETIDLTHKALIPGDLSLPQDGIVDDQDFNYLWDHRGGSAEDELLVGDLNYDGVINMGDISLCLQALNKSDEVMP